jgi:uncharacterized protein YndB with AHSA1/START domain
MTTGTVSFQRVLRAPPERVYRAFLDPAALAKWIPPFGFTATVHHLDARVGGTFRMSFRSFASGQEHAFGGTYLELVPERRLCYTDRFDDPGLAGELLVEVELEAVSCGTSLAVTQSGIPAVIPLEMCHLGWQDSLLQLAQLVETAS